MSYNALYANLEVYGGLCAALRDLTPPAQPSIPFEDGGLDFRGRSGSIWCSHGSILSSALFLVCINILVNSILTSRLMHYATLRHKSNKMHPAVYLTKRWFPDQILATNDGRCLGIQYDSAPRQPVLIDQAIRNQQSRYYKTRAFRRTDKHYLRSFWETQVNPPIVQSI